MADLSNTNEFNANSKYVFANADLCDLAALKDVMRVHKITHIIHLAAESHVDNSIKDASAFIQSNITWHFNLLKMCMVTISKNFTMYQLMKYMAI